MTDKQRYEFLAGVAQLAQERLKEAIREGMSTGDIDARRDASEAAWSAAREELQS